MCNITAELNIYIWRIKIKHMIASIYHINHQEAVKEGRNTYA